MLASDQKLVPTASEGATAVGWTARMIHPLSDKGEGGPASFLTKAFHAAPAGDEVLLISAYGVYKVFLNGQLVSQDQLQPGWTNYDKRLSYQQYDVSGLLQDGENSIDIWLGDGWFRSPLMFTNPIHNIYGDQTGAIAEIRRAGSGELLLATDTSWKSGELPIRKSGIYFGEIFDARIPVEVTAGVEELDLDFTTLIAAEAGPVRSLAPIGVVSHWREDGATIYDFGQNVAGNVAFVVRGEAGARVVIEHGEVLDTAGHFYNGNYRSAAARIEYVLSGDGEGHYTPHFTFQGYRYVRVEIEGQAELVSIQSVPMSSVIEAKAGFECANPLVNRLVQNTLWSQRGNFIDIPTDCPQRDERLGWTGDAQVFAGTACYFADVHGLFRKWMRDLMVDQRADGAVPNVVPDPTRLYPDHIPGFFGSTGWGDAVHEVPWQLYLHYGDEAFLAEALPAMVKWVDYVWSISDGPIVRPPRVEGKRGFTFGDWLQPSGSSVKPLPTIGDDAAATIYLYVAAHRTAKVAEILGETAIAQRLGAMADAVKSEFADEFIAPNGRIGYNDQTSYALAFLHDLIPEDKQEAAADYFRETVARTGGRIGTGFIGTPALLPALVKIGARDLAGQVFLQEDIPGWLYQVKMGATTIWERWDAISPDGTIYNPQMNSYNHYAYGAVCRWLFEAVAGFRPDERGAGFGIVTFEPVIIPSLSPVRAHHDSRQGRIEAEWSVEGNEVTYRFVIPAGARGRLVLDPSCQNAVLDGETLTDGIVEDLAAGQHVCTFTYGPRGDLTVPAEHKHARTPD